MLDIPHSDVPQPAGSEYRTVSELRAGGSHPGLVQYVCSLQASLFSATCRSVRP